ILLDAELSVSAERVAGRGDAKDRFEQEQAAFFGRVRQTYLALADAEPERIKVVDAGRTLHEVRDAVQNILESFCNS
ncbi:MAG: dTMP kinase, partial [Gammaproteobacteria bacterium]|nr:dTMP kinase [Gammaproteobacteria bacterium]